MRQVYPREGCVRGLLQEGPGQAAPCGQVRLCRQREEYAQQTQGDSFSSRYVCFQSWEQNHYFVAVVR
jgi:hypothetical protein